MTKYRVLVGLDYPTSPGIIKRILAGEHDIPWRERKCKHVEPGEVVDDIPQVSLPALLEKGYVVEVVE